MPICLALVSDCDLAFDSWFCLDLIRMHSDSDPILDFNFGTGLCARDGGAGLSFHVRHRDANRVNFYLRGIASVTISNGNVCNLVPLSTFTHVLRHETFLKDNLKDAIWFKSRDSPYSACDPAKIQDVSHALKDCDVLLRDAECGDTRPNFETSRK
ncbi:hypothetical protein EVAR_76166_1 [Eumeta japonica]|uniref:Uncharacterized protein n=1 Tax=Eumeta variegata TaxID=151549 RepID=A0A4C1UVV4_EUMVA|nr:hypothetical protein EVAR_76166_1 [Eumeta japonica]